MDPINQSAPMNTPANTPVSNGGKKVGPIIATLTIVLILIIAALYLFASRINRQSTSLETASTTSSMTTNSDGQPVVATTNDDPASLQADLSASTNALDAQNF